MIVNNRLPLGIDVSKKHFDVALLRAEKYKTKKFSNDNSGFEQLLRWLDQQGVAPEQLHACLEATGVYSQALATYLFDQDCRVSVVNGLQVKGFAQSTLSRTKNDRKDACVLARFCLAMSPEPWQPPAREVRELRALVQRLESLQQMSRQEQNRLEAADPVLLDELQSHIADLERRIEQTRRAIDDHIDRHPGLRDQRELLESIPGVGPATSATLLSVVGEIERFDNAKKLAAFCGVSPQERQSGSSVRGRARLCKIGNASARKSLFFPALVAMKHNNTLRSMRERLLAAGKPKMLIVGAAMRKLVHIIYGVLKNRTPFNEDLSCEIAR